MGDYVFENVKYQAHERPATVVDTDDAKLELLKTAVSAQLARGVDADTFELAVEIRENLPSGLEADDFDGHNIESILQEV